ncbi:MAG: helix-turn-helix domain-containing protein [Pseudomonadales bacterium]|nr:helix-turn-helix domain-containing protein [Pseudomonadales bacterium]
MNFGEKLKQLRQQRDWSQPELSDAIGIEQSYLSKLENAKSVPSAEMLERILETFELSIEEFLEGVDDSEIRNHLATLPQINGHLQKLEQSAYRRKRRWLITSAIFCVLGLTSLIPALFGSGHLLTTYEYISDEIVPLGENGESFESLDAFLEQEFVEAREEIFSRDLETALRSQTIDLAYDALKARYASLSVPAQFSEYQYRGQSFIERVTEGQDLTNLQASNQELGGTRTFELFDTRTLMEEEMRSMNMISGTLFLTLGIFGFILERLLARKN